MGAVEESRSLKSLQEAVDVVSNPSKEVTPAFYRSACRVLVKYAHRLKHQVYIMTPDPRRQVSSKWRDIIDGSSPREGLTHHRTIWPKNLRRTFQPGQTLTLAEDTAAYLKPKHGDQRAAYAAIAWSGKAFLEVMVEPFSPWPEGSSHLSPEGIDLDALENEWIPNGRVLCVSGAPVFRPEAVRTVERDGVKSRQLTIILDDAVEPFTPETETPEF